VKLSTYQDSDFIRNGFFKVILEISPYFRGQVLSRANEHFCVGRVKNCSARPVGSAINGKYSGNKGRKLAMGLTRALAAAIIKTQVDPVRNSIRGNEMTQKEKFLTGLTDK